MPQTANVTIRFVSPNPELTAQLKGVAAGEITDPAECRAIIKAGRAMQEQIRVHENGVGTLVYQAEQAFLSGAAFSG